MLSNTSLEKKIQTAFEICDQDHQGFLTKGQFDKYVQFLIQTSAKFNTSNYFHDDAEAFKETLSNLTSDKEGVFFNDVIGQLLNNDFAKYYTNLPNSGHIEPDQKASHHQKELIADASLVNNNQTVMDSTHDVSHNLHSNLTRLLDHSNEQSTIQEAEGSKYEEDQSRTEELLTEEQKEKILGLDHEIGECHGYINSKNSIQEDHKEVTGESIEQMEPKIPLEKTQEDPENDSEEQMKAMMLKLKSSPKKTAQAIISNEGFVVNKVENISNLDQIGDGFISASKSDERYEALDNRLNEIFNSNKEDEVLKAHSVQRINERVPLPFAKNTLLPLKTTEVDIKPSYLDLSYFENTLKCLPQAHNSVPIHINVKKPVIKTDLLQVLDVDSQSHNIQMEGWKGSCFETTQTSAMVSEIVNKCPIIQKPLINNPWFTPSPEQEQEQYDIPNLHFWRPDEIDHGDLPTKPSTIVAPSRIVQKCVPKLLDVTNKGLSPLQVLNPNDFQPSFENEFVTFNKTNIALKRNEMPCISAPMKRPIFDNSCTSLLQEAPDKRDSSYAIETHVFECFNAPAKENKFVETTAPLKNSFEKADFLAPLSKDFIKESTTLLWKENCFEMNDNKLIESNLTCLIENNQPPFGKEICNPLSPVRKTSDAPVIEGWKEGCFNLTDKSAQHLGICEADSGSKRLNKVEERLLSHHKAEISSSIIWNSEIFECINLPHKASSPSMRLSTGIKLLQKPELSDLTPSTSNKIDVQSELKIFGSISQPVLANNSVSLALKVPKIQKPVFENIAQSLKVDECDDQMIEMNFSFKDSYDQGRAESQECATTSKSVDKVEEYIDDGILAPLAQDKHEETSSSIRLNQLFGIFNKVEAPLQPASDTVSKNVEEELEKSFEEVKEECQWHEREQEIEFKPPEVMEGSALDEKKNRADERSVVLEKNSTQAKEPAERTSLKTNAEDVDRKQLIYDEEDEESDVSSTLITSPTLGENTNVGIYNEIAENENDPQLQNKRKEDANKEAMSEQKSEACKTCNVF